MKQLVYLLLFTVFAHANTPYTLTEIKQLYVVVENGTTLINKESEVKMKQMMLETLQRVGVKTEGYSEEAFALLIGLHRLEFEDINLIKMKLLIGSEVLRKGAKDETFGITYMKEALFDTTDANADTLDALSSMLMEFEHQYKEENEE